MRHIGKGLLAALALPLAAVSAQAQHHHGGGGGGGYHGGYGGYRGYGGYGGYSGRSYYNNGRPYHSYYYSRPRYYYSPDYYSPSYSQSEMSITLGDNYFSPDTITVPVGTTVRWVNGGGHRHTVTSDQGLWDSGPLDPGGAYSTTFTRPGTFQYHCNFHRGMVGTVVVTY